MWMCWHQQTFVVDNGGRGTVEVTDRVRGIVSASRVKTGLCHIFLRHTSASLIVCENADPDVRIDLETFMAATVVDGDARFVHDSEGADDMPAHVRTVLTGSDLTVPVRDGLLDLGTWQGLYLWEHRRAPQRREFTVTVQGRGGDP
jgi:secondary thiamine-phosphate synthase enzyme